MALSRQKRSSRKCVAANIVVENLFITLVENFVQVTVRDLLVCLLIQKTL